MRRHDEQPRDTGISGGAAFLAFLGGAAAGAAAALLLARRTGDENRQRLTRLAQTSRQTVARLPEALAEARKAGTQAFEQAMAEGEG